jgi:hypothetical protein
VIYRVPSHIYHRTLHDEVVLLDPKSDAYLGLNGTAAVVWTTLSAGGNPMAAVAALVERYAVDAETASEDIETLIADLVRRGLLEPVPTVAD